MALEVMTLSRAGDDREWIGNERELGMKFKFVDNRRKSIMSALRQRVRCTKLFRAQVPIVLAISLFLISAPDILSLSYRPAEGKVSTVFRKQAGPYFVCNTIFWVREM